MNKACEICKGACCESFGLDLSGLEDEIPEVYKWIKLHATQEGKYLRFECRCSKLKNGKCSIYNDRPYVCIGYKVGGDQCRHAITTRRHWKKDEIFKALQNELG